jgi:hypothetical protein
VWPGHNERSTRSLWRNPRWLARGPFRTSYACLASTAHCSSYRRVVQDATVASYAEVPTQSHASVNCTLLRGAAPSEGRRSLFRQRLTSFAAGRAIPRPSPENVHVRDTDGTGLACSVAFTAPGAVAPRGDGLTRDCDCLRRASSFR